MTRPAALTAHDRFEALALGRRVAAELAAETLDPAARLPMADRHALVVLAIAVDEEASRRAGAEPLTAHALSLLAAGLAAIERPAVPTHPAPLPAAG